MCFSLVYATMFDLHQCRDELLKLLVRLLASSWHWNLRRLHISVRNLYYIGNEMRKLYYCVLLNNSCYVQCLQVSLCDLLRFGDHMFKLHQQILPVRNRLLGVQC